MIYVGSGDTDQAMKWLEKGTEERFNPSTLLRPGFDPLRSDPRFEDLLRHIGLLRCTRDFAIQNCAVILDYSVKSHWRGSTSDWQ